MAPQPASVLVTCPRCRILRLFVSVNGQATYRCSGCEWYYTLGTPVIAAPGVPLSTVNATNTTGTIVGVTISGGTLTAVTVNAVQVGTTAGTYLVPAGGTINITYSVAPTWTWQLPVTNGVIAAGGLAVPVASGGTYFTAGMQLLIDTAANTEVLAVGSGSTGTSIVVGAGGYLPIAAGAQKAHGSGISFGQLLVTSTYSGAGQDQVPAAPGWGF